MDEKTPSEDYNVAKKSSCLCINIPHFGVICGLLSSVFGASATICAKMMTTSPITFAAYRNYAHYLVLVPLIFYKLSPDRILGPPKRRGRVYLWLQGSCLAITSIFYYLTLGEISAGTTITLSALAMIFTPLLARVLFRATLTIFDCIFALTCVIGVILIAKPSFLFHHLALEKSESALGIIFGILTPFFGSLSSVLMSRIGHGVHFINSMFCTTVTGVCFCTALMYATNTAVIPCSYDLTLIAIVGVLMFLQQISLIIALQSERPGTVAILQAPQILLVYLSEALLLHTVPSTLTLIGSALIFATSICVGVRKIVNERRKQKKSDDL